MNARGRLSIGALRASAASALFLIACEGNISGGLAGTPVDGPSPGGAGTSSGGPQAPASSNAEFSRLTRLEYGATIREALQVEPDVSLVPVDGRVGPFTSNAGAAPDPVHPYLLAGEAVAAAVIPARLPACEGVTTVECVSTNYQEPLQRLYRRPVQEAELAAASTLIQGLLAEGLSGVDATRAMLTAALLSPDFLFRASPSAGDPAARARRVTEHLSYALLDAPPDPQLSAAIAGTPAELSAHSQQLSADPRAAPVLARFVAQWLHVDTDLRLAEPAFRSSPRFLEFVAYVKDALANDVPVKSFISGERGFVHRENLEAYDLDALPGSAEIVEVTWPADSARRGVLAQDLLADSTRHPDPSRRPIFRGLLVRRSLLCQVIPAPSAELISLAGEVGDRTLDPRCAACHLRMDPIGRAFAALDPGGQAAAPAEVIDHPELQGSYESLPALLTAVASSRAFAECFAQQWLAFFLEQPAVDVDPAWVTELAEMVVSGASLGAIVKQSVVGLAARTEAAEPWCKGP